MLYLLGSLADTRGQACPLVGLLPGRARMQERLANLGVHCPGLPFGELCGPSYPHARLDMDLVSIAESESRRASQRGEPVYRYGSQYPPYLHLYFP